MHNVTTSRHIRTATELFIMVPIKNDFVPISELVLTYEGRVSTLLKLLGDLRQQKIERGFGEPAGPIELLNTIYRVQWSVLKPSDDVQTSEGVLTRQLKQPQILLTSNFDSSWEDYFRALVDIGGPLLDLIFSHCEGYDGRSCKDGYVQFSDFIRSHQRPVDFYYATAPSVTIDDVRYFDRLPKKLQTDPRNVRTLTVPTVLAESKARIERPIAHDEQTRAAHRTIQALLDVRKRLFTDAGGIIVTGSRRLTDRMLFDNAVRSILEHEPDYERLASVLNPHALGPHPSAADLPEFDPKKVPPGDGLGDAAVWVRQLVNSKPQEGENIKEQGAASRDAETKGLPAAEKLFSDVQGNILSAYSGIEHGRLMMFQCRDAAALRALLAKAHDAVTTEAQHQAAPGQKPRCNFAITYSGVKRLDLPARVLELFPREFREGMEERAGILGDVGPSHPNEWLRPRRLADGGRLHLSMIHAVVTILGSKGDAFDAALKEWLSTDGAELVHTIDLESTKQLERSQPVPKYPYRSRIQRPDVPPPVARDEASLNQFLLGYANTDDVIPLDDEDKPLPRAYPTNKESDFGNLFVNGSFLAMRKMKQDEAALERYLDRVADLIHDAARRSLSARAGATVGGSGGGRAPSIADIDRKALIEDARALIVGRKQDGTLLGNIQPPAKSGEAKHPSNDFDFKSDPQGELCPFQSHVRRTNPRTRGTPRIVRRGLAYTPETEGKEKQESGLMFMAYCANLARQYEVVQRYVNGANSAGILSRQNDMLCGAPIENDIERVVSLKGTSVAKLVGSDATITLPPRDLTQPFVTLRWGLYLFVPAKSGIDWLADPAAAARWAQNDRAASVARGELKIRELRALPTAQLRAYEWKRVLEEVPEAGSTQAREAEDVAAAITEKWGGVFVIPKIVDDESAEIGAASKLEKTASKPAKKHDLVVVTTERLALEVLRNDDRFSVRHYRSRMNKAIQDHYLGYDHDTRSDELGLDYKQLSSTPNRQFEALESVAFDRAKEIATALLDEPGTIQLDPDGKNPDSPLRHTISVRDLACAVISRLCHEWLDMPGVQGGTSQRELMDSLERFLVASRYSFQVMPVPYLKAKAEGENRKSIERDYAPLRFPLKNPGLNSVTPLLVDTLRNRGVPKKKKLTEDQVQGICKMAVLGAVGFAPPAVGALLRILDQWIETEELWQVQALIRPLEKEQDVLAALIPKIYTAWSKTPAPPTLYRTARTKVPSFGRANKADKIPQRTKPRPVTIERGARVVVNLAAVYSDALENGNQDAGAWLFGGVHGGAAAQGIETRHGCPGRLPGLNALAGIITALLRRKSLRRERRFLLSYER